MPERVATDDDWDDEETEYVPDDDGESEYVPDEDDDPTMPCSHCGAAIHDQSEQCPRCGQYISVEDVPPSRKPWWIVLGAILCLFAVLLWIRS